MGVRGLGGWVSWVKMGVGGFVVECREEFCFGDGEGGEGTMKEGRLTETRDRWDLLWLVDWILRREAWGRDSSCRSRRKVMLSSITSARGYCSHNS